MKRAFIAVFACAFTLIAMACGPSGDTVSREDADRTTERLAKIAQEERKKWLRVLGRGLMVQLFPLATDEKPDRGRLGSLGVKLENFISLQGDGIRALHVAVKRKARKNPNAKFEPLILSSFENNKRQSRFGAKALVPGAISEKYAKERIEFTFSNGTRTDVRLDIYYNQEALESKLKAARARL